MGLFGKSKDTEVGDEKFDADASRLEFKVKKYSEESGYYRSCIETLNENIKEFSFDIEEIGASKFKNHLDDLLKTFVSGEKIDKLEDVFKRYIKVVKGFIVRKKRYFEEKEAEFKHIVKLLTEGITVLNEGNNEFNKSIFEQSTKLLEINELDNIKQIKKVIKNEVMQMRSVIKEKADNDAKQLKLLSKEVTILKKDLEKAETASITDKLTGTHNRLAFDLHMNKLIDKYGVILTSFSIIMIDIDNFKSVNDTYGHLVGDKVIIATVNAAQSFLRKGDFMARFGGEEFVIVLTGASAKNAVAKGNDICGAIRKVNFVIDKKEPEKLLKFTASLGVSTLQDGDSVTGIIDKADKALYQAKRTGKDKVVHFSELKNVD